jgi:HSP20 family protein
MKNDIRRTNWCSSDSYAITIDSYRWKLVAHPHLWQPPTDVYEVEDALIVRVEIAGAREQDLNISLQGQVLAIRGTRLDAPERRAYHQMEIPFGEFGVMVELPCSIAAESIQACYQDGFLKVILPKC